MLKNIRKHVKKEKIIFLSIFLKLSNNSAKKIKIIIKKISG